MSDADIEDLGRTVSQVMQFLDDLNDENATFRYILGDLGKWDGSSKIGTTTVSKLDYNVKELQTEINNCRDLMTRCKQFVLDATSENGKSIN